MSDFRFLCGCAGCAGERPGAATGDLSGQKQTVIATPISGDFRIDVLLDSNNSRWNHPNSNGTPVEVTYSFPTSVPSYLSGDDIRGWSPFTQEQIVWHRQIFQQIAEVTFLSFREVPDTGTSYGTIRLQNNDQGPSGGGYAYFPDEGTERAGDVFINNLTPSNLTGITRGSFADSLFVHEILHAIGIKHPGNYNGSEPPSNVPGNFLIETLDNYQNTIMSYFPLGTQALERSGVGPYDLLALQFLYGIRPQRTGADTYTYSDAEGKFLSMIYDSGGRDTLDASRASVAARINLVDGGSSSIGTVTNGSPSVGNVQIAFNTIIENAIGTTQADTFTGNNANNVYRPNGGNDTADGGAGIDTLVLGGTRAAAQVAGSTITAAGATITQTGFERFAFSDGILAFDVGDGQNAGTVYRIYQAAFNRQPDLPGLSTWVNLRDNGMPLTEITGYFTVSPEFRTIYGANPTNRQLVDAFYQNVLGRPGEAAGIDFWTGQLSGGTSLATALSFFANAPENIARVAPTISGGITLDTGLFALA